MLPWDEVVWPLIGALIAGGLIGLEREWRGRPAGFRTHILVSLSSCLLMLAALHQTHWAFDDLPSVNIMTDPTRMAHGVLTGIGFLCAGVIFRQGFSVHGLTTAASLWMTAALGLLFGAGLIGLAAIGTGVTVVILVALKLVSARVPSVVAASVDVSWKRQDLTTAQEVAALIRIADAKAFAARQGLSDDGSLVCRYWRIKVRQRHHLDEMAEGLAGLEGVHSFRIEADDD